MKAKSYLVQLPRDIDPMNPREMGDCPSHMATDHRDYLFGGGGNDKANAAIGVAFDTQYSPEDSYLTWIFSEFIETTDEGDKGAFSGWYLDSDSMFCLDTSEGLVELETDINRNLADAIEAWAEENLAILPLYLYDHSGITMNTTGFSCNWDSGQVGYIYITKEEYEKYWGNFFSQEKACKFLRAEVEEYDQYLTGEVYGVEYAELTDQEDIDYAAENYELIAGNNLIRCYLNSEDAWEHKFNVDPEVFDSCWGYLGHPCAETTAKEYAEAMCTNSFLEGDFREYKVVEYVSTHDGIMHRMIPKSSWLRPQAALDYLKSLPSVDDVEVFGVIT